MKRLISVILLGILLITAGACANQGEDAVVNFEHSIFIGDSITYGFVANEVLPEENIIGGSGTTAGLALGDIDNLSVADVDNVFVMLGGSDLYMPIDDPKGLFENDMAKLIKKIKDILPNCEIYIQSIMPVTEEALEAEPRYANIGDYNEILQKLASDLSVNYVNVSTLVDENPGLFAEDGIHFKKEFYPLWLKKLSESLEGGYHGI